MMLRFSRVLTAAVVAAIAAAACSNNNTPSSPSDNSGLTASVTVPRPAVPAANASVRFGDQPITLMVQNAAMTSASGAVYTFEVATDSAFSTKVQTWPNVAEGSNGQTTVKLDQLGGGRDYYWHARATAGGTAGPFSSPSKFTVGPAVIVNAPTPIAPLTGVTTTPRPALRVTNATRSGAATITYRFEVANSAAFTTLVVAATVAEGINETGYIPPTNLPVSTTLFWRAIALDTTNGVSSNPSTVQSFTTRAFSQAETLAIQLGEPLWPGAQPSGSFGHATMGNDPFYGVGWQIQTLHYAPANVTFQSPDIEMLRYFDLFDRGYDPDSAIAWLQGNGYPTVAQWYPGPEKAVLGLRYVYIAARGKVVSNATWDVVLRVE
jgi:hypothetical protein